jgi:hypothetical protein
MEVSHQISAHAQFIGNYSPEVRSQQVHASMAGSDLSPLKP